MNKISYTVWRFPNGQWATSVWKNDKCDRYLDLCNSINEAIEMINKDWLTLNEGVGPFIEIQPKEKQS